MFWVTLKVVVQDVQAAAAAAAVFQKCDASSALFAAGRLVSALILTFFSSFFPPVLPTSFRCVVLAASVYGLQLLLASWLPVQKDCRLPVHRNLAALAVSQLLALVPTFFFLPGH